MMIALSVGRIESGDDSMWMWRPSPSLAAPLLITAFLFSARTTAAQTTGSGGLAGIVTDQSNALIPNAKVEISDSSKGLSQSTSTDHAGTYRFFFLAPGRYTLAITHDGFREERRTVDVLLGPPITVNITLAIAQVSSAVTVADDAPLLQAENGDASATLSERQISQVPNPGNDLTYIVQTTPGVVMNTDAAGNNFSILGMPSGSYLYSIDGVDNPVTGILGLLLGQNQVQEATVVSTGYSGQFGNAAGGNINYTTKSGTNQFHGNAQYYWNGRVFNANDWFNNALGYKRPFDIANQWAGSFGGPIRKSKLFFFFDTEGLRVLIPSIEQVLIPSPQFEAAILANIDNRFPAPSPSDVFYRQLFKLYNEAPGAKSAARGSFTNGDLGCVGTVLTSLLGQYDIPCVMHFLSPHSIPNQDALTAARVDWNRTKNDRIFLRIHRDAGHATALASPISPVFDNGSRQTWWQGAAAETHTWGSSAASQFLFAFGQIDSVFGVADRAKVQAAFPIHIWFDPPEQIQDLGDGFQLRNAAVQYQFSGDFVKVGRNHKFGVGASLDAGHSSTDIALTPFLDTHTLDAFYQGGADPNSPNSDFAILSATFQNGALFGSGTSYPQSNYHLGVYSQDEWHARPGLTLTISFRAEHQSNLTCATRCFARLTGPFDSVSHDPDQPYNQAILINQKHAFQGLDNILWSPRFGFAWQPFGVKHNTVLRGGIGVFYDSVDGVGYYFNSNPPLFDSFNVSGDVLVPDENGSLLSRANSSNLALVNAFKAGEKLAKIQTTIPNFSPPVVYAAENHTHEPQYQRWSLQLQQAFGGHTSFSVGYFGHHGIHELVVNPNGNAWGFGTLPAGRCADPIPDCAPDPRFGQAQEFDTKAVSNYNGLVVSFQRHFSSWGQGVFQANYTYSHGFDEVSNGGFVPFSNWNRQPFTPWPQDPSNLRGAYGPADYDVRHSLNGSYVWELPVKAALRGHGPNVLLNGWQVSGTIFVRTGLPYTVLDILPPSDLVEKNYWGILYAVPVAPLGSSPACGNGAAIPLAPHPCLPTETLGDGITPGPNAMFVQPGCETGFNTGKLGVSGVCDGSPVSFTQGRNRFRGPGYFNTDFAILKNTKLPHRENATLGIGFQFFNFFNHPNFGFPSTYLGPGTGLISYLEQPPTSLLGTGPSWAPIDVAPRMIQLKAELKF